MINGREEKEKTFSQNISLLVIAIFLPVFLEYLPSAMERIGKIVPLFKLNLVIYVSIFLGILWFIILFLEITFLKWGESGSFSFFFNFGKSITVIFLSGLFFSYGLYLLSLLIFGQFQLLIIIAIILGIVAIVLNRLINWGVI